LSRSGSSSDHEEVRSSSLTKIANSEDRHVIKSISIPSIMERKEIHVVAASFPTARLSVRPPARLRLTYLIKTTKLLMSHNKVSHHYVVECISLPILFPLSIRTISSPIPTVTMQVTRGHKPAMLYTYRTTSSS
jgi:hypothetical protein